MPSRERVRRRLRAILLPLGVAAAALAVGVPAAQAVPTVTLDPPASPVQVNDPVAFHATATTDDGAAITEWIWVFGDNTPGEIGAGDITHQYTAAGSYTVTVTATDENGRPSSASGTVQVLAPAPAPIVAAFTFPSAAPDVGQPVKFDAAGSSAPGASITSYAWNFGDGATGTGSAPSHTYATGGDKAVTLTVTASDERAATVTHVVHVNTPPPPAPRVDPAPAATPPATGGTLTSAPAVPDLAAPVATSGATGIASTSSAPAALKVLRVRVQIAGSMSRARTRITRLVVLAPRGATLVARCSGSGKGCPARGLRAQIGSGGRLRLTAMERSLRAGARIVLVVTKHGFAARRIVLTIRAGSAPARRDACLVPSGGGMKEGRCPAA